MNGIPCVCIPRLAVSTLAFACAFALVGCGGSDTPELHHFDGKLTRNGEPVQGVKIIFTAPGKRPSTAYVEDDGTFLMRYTAAEEGVVAGENIVTFQALPPDPEDPPVPEELTTLFAAYESGEKELKIQVDEDTSGYELKLDE